MKHYCLARSMANNLKLSEDEEAPTVVSTESEQPFQEHGLGCPRDILTSAVLQAIVLCAGLLCSRMYSLLR
jgi:hypothetical protein